MTNKTPTLFDPAENWNVTAAAINTAADAADAKVPLWSDRCYRLLERFVNERSEFTSEDFREYCEANGLPIPDEKRAFGGVIMAASKRGLITATGRFSIAKQRQSHCNPKKVWTKNFQYTRM